MSIREKISLAAAFAACSVLATASASRATVLAVDSFRIGVVPESGQYSTGLLAGQAPYTGPLFYNTWVDQTAGQFVKNTSAVLPYSLPGYAAPVGGSVSAGVDFQARTLRQFSAGWNNTTAGTFYMSFLSGFGTDPGTAALDFGYRAVEGHNGGAGDGNRVFQVGYSQFGDFGDSSAFLGMRVKNSTTGTGGTLTAVTLSENIDFDFDAGKVHLFVVKFVLSATAASDTISIYLDPTSTTVEPSTPSATVGPIDFVMDRLSTQTLFNGTVVPNGSIFDELRVATTYSESLNTNAALTVIPGDVDGVGGVTIEDFNIIKANFRTAVTSRALGDLTNNGFVDLADFMNWRNNAPPAVAASASIPEPSSAELALLLAAATLTPRGLRLTRRDRVRT